MRGGCGDPDAALIGTGTAMDAFGRGSRGGEGVRVQEAERLTPAAALVLVGCRRHCFLDWIIASVNEIDDYPPIITIHTTST